MTPEEYAYLEATLTGRRGRDMELESKMSIRPEGKFARQAEERRQALAAKTPTERELEQRAFSLATYGRTHMERYARPIVTGPYGKLSVPGDQLQGHAQIAEPCEGAGRTAQAAKSCSLPAKASSPGPLGLNCLALIL